MGKKSGENLRKSSAHNRGLVLQLAATGEAVTRIELARQTGLTKMTISNIVSEFLEKGLLEECEEKLTQNCGRNPICLKVSGLAPKIVGLLIFRSRLETVLCDLRLQILRRARWDFTELDRESLISRSCDLIDQVSAGEERILGIGVASIGPVNMKEGMILNPPRFFGISHVPVVEELRKRYPWPVCLDHDSNSAAQAEKLFGVGKKVQDFLFLEVTDGIGSGIVSNGEVIHNSRGYAPEIGHISIHGDGELRQSGLSGTVCGRQCCERAALPGTGDPGGFRETVQDVGKERSRHGAPEDDGGPVGGAGVGGESSAAGTDCTGIRSGVPAGKICGISGRTGKSAQIYPGRPEDGREESIFWGGRPASRSCRQYSCAGVFGKNFGLDPLLN